MIKKRITMTTIAVETDNSNAILGKLILADSEDNLENQSAGQRIADNNKTDNNPRVPYSK